MHRGGKYPSFIIAATSVRRDAVETSQILQKELQDAGASASLIVVDYPGVNQLKAHGMIATDLTNLNCDMAKTLIKRVLTQDK